MSPIGTASASNLSWQGLPASAANTAALAAESGGDLRQAGDPVMRSSCNRGTTEAYYSNRFKVGCK